MPTALIGSRKINYVRRGSGQPLLLIQGMAGHHQLWGEPFLSGLVDDFDIVAYDHRGIGDSDDEPGPFTIGDLAEDAALLMDALGWPSAHVLGISMGGMVAQELVLRHPDRVRGLVLGCTYAGGHGSSLDATGPLRMLEAARGGDIDKAIRAGYEVNLSATYTAVEQHYQPFKQVSLAVRVPIPIVLRQAQAAFGHDTSTRLPTVRSSTLVIHGTEDQMLTYSNGVQISGLVPGARLHTMQGVGHLFWWERNDETVDVVREHLLAAT
jgi:3-oxoadipate enol-lactonase